MDHCSWSNVLSDDWKQRGCTSVWYKLQEASPVLADTSEDPPLTNPMSNIVLPLCHQGLK